MQEADQIDATTASHEAFLEFDDVGVSTVVCIQISHCGWVVERLMTT